MTREAGEARCKVLGYDGLAVIENDKDLMEFR